MTIANTDCQPRIFHGDESLDRLNFKFPGLTQRKVLFTLTSNLKRTVLEVYLIKVGEELVRFGILVDGVDTHMISNLRGQTSEFIE